MPSGETKQVFRLGLFILHLFSAKRGCKNIVFLHPLFCHFLTYYIFEGAVKLRKHSRQTQANAASVPKKDSVKRKVRGAFGFRTVVLATLMIAVLTFGCLGRVAYIMAVNGEEYRKTAANNQLRDTVVKAVRGSIYDCNMTPLVTSTSSWNLCVNSYKLNLKFKKTPEKKEACFDFISERIGEILNCSVSDVNELLLRDSSPDTRIRKNITTDERTTLESFFSQPYELENGQEIDLRDYFFYENSNVRNYPENNFASTLIGVVNADGDGETGIESYYNDTLKGKDGRVLSLRDSRGNEISTGYETIVDAKEGNGIVLTVDKNIQTYLENALSKALSRTKAKGVYGIVMDVDTGAVLAMSDKPDFDLNNPRQLSENADLSALEGLTEGTKEYKEKYSELLFNQWNSFCITSNYEPGSTFKIFTLAAALEAGVATENTGHNCTSSIRVADTVYHCANHKAHGSQTLCQGLMNSCNTFFITLGQKLGVERYYDYFEKFGFTQRTGIDAANESISVVHRRDKMSIVDLASTSFGQSVRITPLQIVSAACAIANGGNLMKPYLVAGVTDSDGNLISKTEPVVRRRVISESTSKTVREMMEAVVSDGTGKNAYLEGYRIAGKTGTAQKLDSGSNTYIASFLSFAPADDPKVCVLIGIDSPSGYLTSGGALAAPVAKEVLKSTLDYLNVQPNYTEKEIEKISAQTPSLEGMPVWQAKNTAQAYGFKVRQSGSGETVVSQFPAAGQRIPEGGVVIIYTDKAEESLETKVPDFVGKTVSQVNVLATENSLNVIFSGSTQESASVSYSQSIQAGSLVKAGTTLTVYFANIETPAD